MGWGTHVINPPENVFIAISNQATEQAVSLNWEVRFASWETLAEDRIYCAVKEKEKFVWWKWG